MNINKAHRCIHLQNLPDWQLPYDGVTVQDKMFETLWLLCRKCCSARKGSGWKIIAYPLSTSNAEKNKLQTKVPF